MSRERYADFFMKKMKTNIKYTIELIFIHDIMLNNFTKIKRVY